MRSSGSGARAAGAFTSCCIAGVVLVTLMKLAIWTVLFETGTHAGGGGASCR
jgi:hypothetical protein